MWFPSYYYGVDMEWNIVFHLCVCFVWVLACAFQSMPCGILYTDVWVGVSLFLWHVVVLALVCYDTLQNLIRS